MHKRQKQESDTQYSNQSFRWINDIHKYGLYDMPILGNIEQWVDRIEVTKLEPRIVYYEESDKG